MSRRFPFGLRRTVPGLASVLCLALVACSSGGDSTAPNGPPTDEPPVVGPGNPGHNPPPGPGPDQPPPPPPPPPPAPDYDVTGTYGLTKINDSQPGQMVLLSNPGGNVIGLYRFDVSSALSMTDQTWAFSIILTDEKNVYQIDNQGTFTRSGDRGEDVTFVSELDGKVFSGSATDGSMVFTYDLDGDGKPDTSLGFIKN